MQRRRFLRSLGQGIAVVGASSAIAKPAIAQTLPTIRWRMVSSFPKTLDGLYGGVLTVAQRVASLTGNRFQIQDFAAGEIVPALQVLDAVQAGTVECGQTVSYYYTGKDPTFGFDAAIPFGMNLRQQNAWQYHGGGIKLIREFLRDYNVVQFPAGNTGTQMGGWFRKEIKSLNDLKGLKFRISGFAGNIVARLGVVPQTIGGGDVYPALERGTIDAAEWVGPYDDERLGFHRVAPFYYYPGFWEPAAQVSIYVNQKQWDGLPSEYKSAFEVACLEANMDMLAKFDANNTPALRRLIAAGAQLRAFPRDVLEAAYKATFEILDELSGSNPKFKKIYVPWREFRKESALWLQLAEASIDNFIRTHEANLAKGGR